MKHAKGGAGEKCWQENLKQTDPIKADITQEQNWSKAHGFSLPSSVRERGSAEGPSGSKEAGFPE